MIRTERESIKGEETMMGISMNRHLMGMIKGMATLAVAVLLGFFSPARALAVDLLHNSRDTASPKWQAEGGWGIAGGKYGEFTCSTCHEPNTNPNIKNVRRTIRTRNGENWPGGQPAVTVEFKNVTGMGEDAGGHAGSSRICEVCHSANRFHNANTANNTGGLSHPSPKAVCTSCHKHNTGFKAACGGCHGNPPKQAVLGGDTGLIGTPRPSFALMSGQAGAHVTHTETRAMVCDTCHYISNGTVKMPNLSNSIDIGFFGFGGKVTSGTYTPYTSAGRGYRIASGTPNSTIAAAVTDYPSANRCSGVYCHGGGVKVGQTQVKPPLTGGSNTAPRWDGAAQDQCGSCHGTTAATPPTMGSHVKHSGAASGYSFACDLCHPSIDISHVQGNVRWRLLTTDPRVGATAGYQAAGTSTPAAVGATGDLAPSAAYGQCSNLYCHSDGRGGAPRQNPTWGDAAYTTDCINCHGNNAASLSPMNSGGHKAHINNASARFNNFNFNCSECHNRVVDSTNAVIVNRSLHVNNSKDIDWGPTANGSGSPYGATGCSQIYCHSNGRGSYKAPVKNWSQMSATDEGTVGCDYCHGGLAADSAPVSSDRHTNHISTSPAGGVRHKGVGCDACHDLTVANNGTAINAGGKHHINRSIEVTFKRFDNRSGVYSNDTTRTCSTMYCHGTAIISWNTTAVTSCGACHAANNTATSGLSAAHRRHYNTTTLPDNDNGWTATNASVTNNVFTCGTCHPQNPEVTHINGPANPVNGSAAEVVLTLPFSVPVGAERPNGVTRGTGQNADGRGYFYSTGTTCDTYCHSDGRGGPSKIQFNWTSVTASCGNCHNKAGDPPATTTWSKAHDKHATTYNGNVNLHCGACHAATASANNTLISGKRDRHPNGYRNVSSSAGGGNFRWDGTTCTNVYCHYSRPVQWSAVGSLPADCTGCHGGSAASASPIGSRGHKAHVNNTSQRFGGFNFNCNECHNSTVNGTNALISYTLHANKANDVAWGPKSTGGPDYASSGCSQIYCHSNGQGRYKSPPMAWNGIPDGQQGTIECNYCHNGLAGVQGQMSSNRHLNHINAGPLPHRPATCNDCHSSTVAPNGSSIYSGPNTKHINRSLDVSFLKMGNFSGVWTKSNSRCTSTYCHGSNTQTWTTTTLNTCGSCHEANNSTTSTAKLSDAHRKHYNRTTRPSNTTEEGWTNVNLSSTNNVFMCGTCHPANPTEKHLNGPPPGVTNGSVAEIVLRLPFTTPQGSGRPETVTRGSGVNYDGRGYGYSTGTSCDTYCHSDGRGGPPKNVMQWAVSTTSCGNCHDQASNNPATTTWSAPHNKHANTYGNGGTIGSNNTTTNNTLVTCAACHASTASSNTALVTGQRAKHPNGFRNISASSTVGSAAFRWDSGSNQCKNGYCHSRAYSFTDYSTPWIKWDLTQAVTCGSCHKSYPTGPDYANGYKGKANSHPKHAVFWGFTCDWCHSQTVVYRNNSTVISNYRNHVNKSYNVVANSTKVFIGKTNSFTATATTNPPSVKTTCTSVNCHGGNTSKVFVWGGTNKCGDCHFATSDTVNYGFKNGTMAVISRTEWRYSGHGKVSGNYDITGATFAGFSAAAANGTGNPGGDPCLYCHDYSGVQHGSADNPLRLRNFNSGVQTWGRNSVCLVCHATSGASGVQPAAGYLLKTASRKVDKYHYGSKHSTSLTGGQFCWDCHDAHGDRASSSDGRPIAMIHKKPAKGSDSVTGMPTFLTATTVGNFVNRTVAANFGKATAPYNALCNVCHDYKASDPNRMVHYTATSSDSHNSTQVCTDCHKHSADTAYNGKAYEGSGGPCNSCHDATNSGSLSVGTTAGHAIHYNQATVFNNLTGSNKTTSTAYGFACKNCHPTNLHNEGDGTADILTGVNYTSGGSTTTDARGFSYTVGGTCSTNQCHQDGRGGPARAATVTWTAARSADNCGICHGNPPLYGISSSAHRGKTPTTSCNGCHNNVNPNGTIANVVLHLNGIIEGPTCVSCHSKPVTRTKGRPGTQLAAVSGEFGLAWGHKKSGRGTVTAADCIVCHLEGNAATGKPSTTYHQDGKIDLRDPDGTGEQPITNISGNVFTFARFSTSFASGTRTATGHTSNDIANVITQKFCLACHDSNGATNTSARSGAGTATMPFGGVNLGANYTVANGASVAGGVVNVKAQFATTNSSAHPVLGPRNKDYPTAARFNNPYKPAGTRGTSGTRSLGVVINCFDCHNKPTPQLTLRTVVAHGADATNYLRGVATVSSTPSTTNNVTFCKGCHIGYDPGGTTNHHGSGSALSTSTNSGMVAYVQYGCNMCHSSGYSTPVVRPVRGQDVHGVNVLPTGGVTKTTRWAGTSTGSPARIDAKPYAFIRNTQVLSDHSPKSISGSTYSPNCNMASGSPIDCNQGVQSYSVGGTY